MTTPEISQVLAAAIAKRSNSHDYRELGIPFYAVIVSVSIKYILLRKSREKLILAIKIIIILEIHRTNSARIERDLEFRCYF